MWYSMPLWFNSKFYKISFKYLVTFEVTLKCDGDDKSNWGMSTTFVKKIGNVFFIELQKVEF